MAYHGRAYLKSMGLRPVTDLEAAIYRLYGPRQGEKCVAALDQLFTLSEQRVLQNTGKNPLMARQSEMVQFLNQDYSLSILFASFYDWAVLGRICDWLEDLFPLFGNVILDLGCGNGLLTGFIAKSLPDRSVYGLDVCLRENPVWREVLTRTGSGNLAFFAEAEKSPRARKPRAKEEKKPEAKDEKKPGQRKNPSSFDTLLSIRCFHENVAHPPILRGECGLWAKRRADCRSHARLLSGYLTPGGRLFLLDRQGEMGYWDDVMAALQEEGFVSLPGTETTFTCHEGEGEATFRGVGLVKRAEQRQKQ